MSPRDLGADAGAHGFDPRTSAFRTERECRFLWLGDAALTCFVSLVAGAVTAIASLSRGTTTRENPTPARSSTGADQPLTPGRRQTLNEATVLR
jgi:hypothetical protein